MVMTRVVLPTSFPLVNAPVAYMFVNTIVERATPGGVKAPTNGVPLTGCGSKLTIRAQGMTCSKGRVTPFAKRL